MYKKKIHILRKEDTYTTNKNTLQKKDTYVTKKNDTLQKRYICMYKKRIHMHLQKKRYIHYKKKNYKKKIHFKKNTLHKNHITKRYI